MKIDRKANRVRPARQWTVRLMAMTQSLWMVIQAEAQFIDRGGLNYS